MLFDRFKCKKNKTKKKQNKTESITPKVSKTNNCKAVILSKWATYGSKQWRVIKKQEANGILSNLGLETPLSKIPFLNGVPLKVIGWMKQSISFY